MNPQTVEIAVNGFVFDGLASGPPGGRPVLLLHGFPQTCRCWRHQLHTLGEAGYRALAFDQRGYSPRARPDSVDDYRIDELVADVMAVADELGWDRFDLVGHDWGGAVAWTTAATEPARIRTLNVVSTPHPAALTAARGGDTDQKERSSYIDTFRAEGGVAERILLGADGSGSGLRTMFSRTGLRDHREEVEFNVAKMLEPGALTAALNWYRAMSATRYAGIGPVAVPTLYVWSTQDAALGRHAAQHTANWVKGPYRFEVLDGVSHWIPEEAPEQLSTLLVEHLAANG